MTATYAQARAAAKKLSQLFDADAVDVMKLESLLGYAVRVQVKQRPAGVSRSIDGVPVRYVTPKPGQRERRAVSTGRRVKGIGAE